MGGYNVGWTANGEWLAHNNITFPTTGAYTLAYRVAAPPCRWRDFGRPQRGHYPAGQHGGSATGGWQNWTTVQRTINVNA
ncbi:carbohydrate-binding protein [Massilia sp. B-10]|nr:carbohydrate-binding protein [Massilia sp. B-10]